MIEPKHIDEVNRAVGTAMTTSFKHMTPLERTMGMMLAAAHEAFHDDATEEDFVKVARAAWKKTLTVHEQGQHDA